MRRVVVVGASLAGLRAAEAVRRLGFDGSLTLIGDEPYQPYDRPPLSKGVQHGAGPGEQFGSSVDENTAGAVGNLALRQAEGLHADWILGQAAVRLDPVRRTVDLDDGRSMDYDGLVLACGATPRLLPGLPARAPGMHYLRTLDDALGLRVELVPGARAVIVGGGFIGAELASTCRDLGLEVTVVTPLPLMVTALGELSGPATQRARRHGVRLIEGLGVQGVLRDNDRPQSRVVGVELSDRSCLAADVVVIAVGVVPAVGWLDGSGVRLANGIVCDETMAVQGEESTPAAIVAAGDVACWPHPALGDGLLRLEHWTNASEQAVAAATRLVRGRAQPYVPVPSFWSDQFGIRLQGVGLPGHGDEVKIVDGDPAGDAFVAEYRRQGVLVGAVVAGNVRALLPYRKQLAEAFTSADR